MRHVSHTHESCHTHPRKTWYPRTRGWRHRNACVVSLCTSHAQCMSHVSPILARLGTREFEPGKMHHEVTSQWMLCVLVHESCDMVDSCLTECVMSLCTSHEPWLSHVSQLSQVMRRVIGHDSVLSHTSPPDLVPANSSPAMRVLTHGSLRVL